MSYQNKINIFSKCLFFFDTGTIRKRYSELGITVGYDDIEDSQHIINNISKAENVPINKDILIEIINDLSLVKTIFNLNQVDFIQIRHQKINMITIINDNTPFSGVSAVLDVASVVRSIRDHKYSGFSWIHIFILISL